MVFYPERIPRSLQDFSKMIDHTVLKPNADINRVYQAIEETEKYGFRSLVIPPWILEEINGTTRARLATVISFPHGNDPLSIKKKQVETAINNGASDVDIVINIMALLSGKRNLVEKEAEVLTKISHDRGVTVKFIIETGYLSRELMEWVARMLVDKGVDYVKTCTGYGPRGVTFDDVIVLRRVLGEKHGIKASGGIRTGLQAALLVGYGADILGTSSSIKIIEEYMSALKILGLD
jgi:deoxyribose-phosphate aldolase